MRAKFITFAFVKPKNTFYNMAKVEITYGIISNGVVVAAENISITLNKKDISEIEETLASNGYSPMFSDLPERIYKRCCKKALEAAPALCATVNVEPSVDIPVAFSEVLPLSLAEVLGEEAQAKVKENMRAKLPELFS